MAYNSIRFTLTSFAPSIRARERYFKRTGINKWCCLRFGYDPVIPSANMASPSSATAFTYTEPPA
jgi:hypothetical protein